MGVAELARVEDEHQEIPEVWRLRLPGEASYFHIDPIHKSNRMTKFGAVSYLNTKPLIYSMEREFENAQNGAGDSLELDLPSRLADRLVSGELDVALIPIVETFRNPELEVVSDACIACAGPVWSVKLLSEKPLDEIKSVALDEGSRTSAAMVRVMLGQGKASNVRFESLPIENDWKSVGTDAVLIIGDRAMDCHSDRFQHQWDLGQWWFQTQRLPFVFAVWAARREFTTESVSKILQQSRDAGCSVLKEIASLHAPEYGLTEEQCFNYLKSNLHFRLSTREKVAIEKFLGMATDLGLVDRKRELLFHD